jgi:hypothetical protein
LQACSSAGTTLTIAQAGKQMVTEKPFVSPQPLCDQLGNSCGQQI